MSAGNARPTWRKLGEMRTNALPGRGISRDSPNISRAPPRDSGSFVVKLWGNLKEWRGYAFPRGLLAN